MNYLILSQPDLDRAWNLSAAIWKLSSPVSVQDAEGRQTTHWSEPVQHPTTGEVALALPDYPEYIHTAADMRSVSPYLTDVLSENERTAVGDQVRGAKGGRLSFSAILGNAPSLTSKIKTQEQMEADGWFPDAI